MNTSNRGGDNRDDLFFEIVHRNFAKSEALERADNREDLFFDIVHRNYERHAQTKTGERDSIRPAICMLALIGAGSLVIWLALALAIVL